MCYQYWKLVHILTLKNIFPFSALKIAPLFASYPFGLSDVLHGDEVLIFFDTVLPGAGLERENLSLTWTFIISMQINLKSNFKSLSIHQTEKEIKKTLYIFQEYMLLFWDQKLPFLYILTLKTCNIYFTYLRLIRLSMHCYCFCNLKN